MWRQFLWCGENGEAVATPVTGFYEYGGTTYVSGGSCRADSRTSGAKRQGGFCRPAGRPFVPLEGGAGVRKVGESDAVHQNFRSEATRRLLPTGRKAVRPPGRGCRGLGRSENPTLFIRTASDGCRPAEQGCAPLRLRGRLWNVP